MQVTRRNFTTLMHHAGIRASVRVGTCASMRESMRVGISASTADQLSTVLLSIHGTVNNLLHRPGH